MADVPFLKVLRSLSCMFDGSDMFSLGMWVLSAFSDFRLADSLCGKISNLD